MSNRTVSQGWRNELVIYLRDYGFRSVSTPSGQFDLSGPIPGNGGRLVGLPWTIVTRRAVTIALSETVDRAAAIAADEGNSLHASLIYRRDRDAAGSYAVMPTSVFAQVLAQLHPELTEANSRRSA